MAAAKLCCNARLRSGSPDDEPSRPIRPFRSLANIKSHLSANKTTSSPVTGSTDENRPTYPVDDLEIRRIFVAASLPEDHPDAFRIQGRKADLNESIIRSPSFTKKLRKQLSRKSLATGSSSTDTIKYPMARSLKISRKNSRPMFRDSYDQDARSLDLPQSRLTSLKFEKGPSMTNEPNGKWRGSSTQGDDVFGLPLKSAEEPRRSISVPLVSCPPSPVQQPRRSRSFSGRLPDLGQALDVQLPGCTFLEPGDMWPLCPVEPPSPTLAGAPDVLHVQKSPEKLQAATRALLELPPSTLRQWETSPVGAHQDITLSVDRPKMTQNNSTQSLHLHNMQISQHLRSTSQKSDETASSNADPPQWAIRASLNSIMFSTLNTKHRREISNSGLGTSDAPSAWSRMMEDEASSIYSRRPSTALESRPTFTTGNTCELSLTSSKVEKDNATNRDLLPASTDVDCGMAEEATPTDSAVDISSGDSLHHSRDLLVSSSADTSRFGRWSGRHTSDSLPKSDSSGSLGKLSRFKEDLLPDSPATKTTWKRRSVLRIFLPKHSKPKLRSASTPLLAKKQSNLAMYDGPSDASELLSVPTPSLRPFPAERGLSSSDAAEVRPTEAPSTGSLAVPSPVPSRQSLVEYERNLSVAGDSRRRKSTMNESIDQAAQVQDQLEPPKRGLHRAAPLSKVSGKGTEEALMEKALQQHQLEKAALLRTNSRKTQPITPTTQAPVFKSPFDVSSSDTLKGTLAGTDDLDPLDAEGLSGPCTARRSQSMHDLQPSRSFLGRLSKSGIKKPSTVWTTGSVAESGTPGNTRSMPPNSWSQFPSQTRPRRCSTASLVDGIISRDFAYAFEPDYYDQDEIDSSSNSINGRSPPTKVKRKNWVSKSSSMTFGAVYRYYSTLLTSSAARNRRSSVTTGGRLEHPELEVLPPVLSSHDDTTQHTRVKSQLDHLTDQINEEGQHLKEESHRILGHRSLHVHSPQPQDAQAEGHDRERSLPAAPDLAEDPEGTPRRGVSEPSMADIEQPTGVDGTLGDESSGPGLASSAQRLSYMYQTCVALPTSLDDTEVDQSERIEGYERLPDSSMLSSKDRNMLTVPAAKARMSLGPIVRRFPSATIVDDGKGHFRSISLISVDSGKSVRKSTRDLLELVKAMEVQELAKLMGASDDPATAEFTS